MADPDADVLGQQVMGSEGHWFVLVVIKLKAMRRC
jgi:hypothetical protein